MGEKSKGARGVVTLVIGQAEVRTRLVKDDSIIFLTAQDDLTSGALRVSARKAGVGFTITSTGGIDSGLVGWKIEEAE